MSRSVVWLHHGAAGSPRIWDRVISRLGQDVRTSAMDFHEGGTLVHVGQVVLAGNGVGSLTAAHWALDPRMRIRRGVVMTGPVGLAGDGHGRLGWLSHNRPGAALLRFVGTTFGRRKFLRDQLANPDADPEAAAILLDGLRRARNFCDLARLNRPESLAGLRELKCPVTVLWGDKDGVLPVTRAAEFMTHLPPHARLRIVEGAAHALPLERPDLVAQAIVELA